MNVRAWLNTVGTTSYSLPIVIFYVTEGCNLQCTMCSYRESLPSELTLDEIKQLARSLADYGLQHIVYSGGEPLLRKDFPMICEIFQHYQVKQSLLTNGLLLSKRLNDLNGFFSEIIVSLDGATAETHNAIRGVESFDLIVKGIQESVQSRKAQQVSIRTVIQKKNFREIERMVDLAHALGVKRISFLAVDVLSDSFGRHQHEISTTQKQLALSNDEVNEFRDIVDRMIMNYANEFRAGFISESPNKMLHIVQYYQALLGQKPFPRNHCNAPMISAVITSSGELQPCFFLPSFGNVRTNTIIDHLNSSAIRSTRKSIRQYELERCQTCVCTLNMSPVAALLDRV